MDTQKARRFLNRLIKLTRNGHLTWEYILQGYTSPSSRFETSLENIKIQLLRTPYSDEIHLFIEDGNGDTVVIDDEDVARRFFTRLLVKELWDLLWEKEWAESDTELKKIHNSLLTRAAKLVGLR